MKRENLNSTISSYTHRGLSVFALLFVALSIVLGCGAIPESEPQPLGPGTAEQGEPCDISRWGANEPGFISCE